MFPAVFNLANLNSTNGFVINSGTSGASSIYLGSSVSAAGDINGDGFGDVIVSAPNANSNTGQAYVIFGSKNSFLNPFNVTSINGTNGFIINTIKTPGAAEFQFSLIVGGVGDVNGDGIDDIGVGAPNAPQLGIGQAYIIFGSKLGFPLVFDVRNINGANGFIINGQSTFHNFGYLGNAISSAGDVNNDGINDLIIGAYQATPWKENYYAGESYIIYGNRSGFPSPFNVTTYGLNEMIFQGYDYYGEAGFSVGGGGDVNGDGIADVIIGARYANVVSGNNMGQGYVVFGADGNLPSPNGPQGLYGQFGFVINAINPGDLLGWTVSNVGDVNNDGIDDIILSARNANNNNGQCYVIFGSNSAFSNPFDVSDLNGDNGFTINTPYSFKQFGFSLGKAGDVNGDGISDIIIGAPGLIETDYGYTYVIFGSNNGFSPSISVGSLNGYNGFAIRGVQVEDESGFSVSGAGDVNGDGIDDVIIGAPYWVPFRPSYPCGQAYVVFGQKQLPQPTPTSSPSHTPTATSSPHVTPTPSSEASFYPNNNVDAPPIGAVVGGVIGGIAAIGLGIGIGYLYCKGYLHSSGETTHLLGHHTDGAAHY